MLCGLSVGLAFRAGIVNIGADGQLLAGATAATAVAILLPGLPGPLGIPLVLLAGTVAGVCGAFVPAWLRQRFGVLEVISTIMMNFVVLYLVGYLVRGPLQEPTRINPQSATLADAYRLPFVIPGVRLHAGFVLALVLAGIMWWYLRATAGGFRVRVLGANPSAAASAGEIDVPRTTLRVFLVSGALAGLAGSIEVTGVTMALYENLSPGYGFSAIAVALLAGLNPLGVVVSAVFLGGLTAGAAAMQREAGVPSVFVAVIEAAVILGVLASRDFLTRQAHRLSDIA
jgi:simple sugar transport system permease protein